jgi:hypothetical protein
LLGSSDEEIAFSALKCLYLLSFPPLAHRCDKYISRAPLSSLHKQPDSFQLLFDIVDNCYFKISLKSFLSEQFIIPEELASISIDQIPSFSAAAIESTNITSYASDIAWKIKDIFSDSRSLAEILSSSDNLSPTQKRNLVWLLRIRKMLLSREGRVKIVEILFQATYLLLSAFPDKNRLYKFFFDKLDLIKDFIWLISETPEQLNDLLIHHHGSNDERMRISDTTDQKERSDELMHLRIYALQCLSATLESRDSTSPPLFVHFSWILHDLGVTKGQYMGLVPCLIRFSVSFLIRIRSSSFSSLLNDVMIGHAITWIENLFLLLASLVNVSLALPALTDNGLIASLLEVIKTPAASISPRNYTRGRETDLLFVDALCLEILGTSFDHHPTSLSVFSESSGLEIVINRLHHEIPSFLSLVSSSVSSSVSSGKYHFQVKLMIQNLILILSAYIQEFRGDLNDFQRELHRNPIFLNVASLVFNNAETLPSSVVSTMISILADIINKDPAPPNILNALLSTSILEESLTVLPKVKELEHALPNMMIGLISAVSLNKMQGIPLIETSAVIQSLVKLFLDDRFYFPQSKAFMVEMPSQLGSSFEQLSRHYPNYLPVIISSFLSSLNSLFTTVEDAGYLTVPNSSSSNLDNIKMNFDEEFALLMNKVVALMICVEHLLEKRATCDEFLAQSGLTLLWKLKRMSLGPLRFYLISLATTTDSTLTHIGYPALEGIIRRSLEKVAIHHQKAVFEEAVKATRYYLSQVLLMKEQYSIDLEKVLLLINDQPLHEYLLSLSSSSNASTGTSSTPSSFLPVELIHFTNFLRCIALVDFSVEILSVSTTAKSSSKGQTPTNQPSSSSFLNHQEAVTELIGNGMSSTSTSTSTSENLLDNLLNFLYLPLSNGLSSTMNEKIHTNMKKSAEELLNPPVQPNFLLRVLAENAVVKDSYEDYAKRLYRFSKGLHIVATERKLLNNGNSVRYRVADEDHDAETDNIGKRETAMTSSSTSGGWISTLKSMTSADPQVIVIDISRKNDEEYEKARTAAVTERKGKSNLSLDQQQRLNPSITARRAGFLSFAHLNLTIRNFLFMVIPKMLITRNDHGLGRRELTLPSVIPGSSVSSVIPVVLNGVDTLLPSLKVAPVSLRDYLKSSSYQSFVTSVAASSFSSSTLSSERVDRSDPLTDDKFLVTSSFPNLSDLPVNELLNCCKGIEVCQPLFFDSKRSIFASSSHRNHSVDHNALLFIHMFYHEKNLFLRFLETTTLVFQCSCNPFIKLCEVLNDKKTTTEEEMSQSFKDIERSLFPSSSSVKIPASFHQLSDEELELRNYQSLNPSSSLAAYSETSSEMEVDDAASSSSTSDGSAMVIEDYRVIRLAYRERRRIASSYLSKIFELWKFILTSLSSHPSSFEKSLLSYFSDEQHDYNPEGMKRTALLLMVQYLYQIWTSHFLFSLPSHHVKNVLDLITMIIKCLHEVKGFALKTTKSSSKSSSSSAFSSSMMMDTPVGMSSAALLDNLFSAVSGIPHRSRASSSSGSHSATSQTRVAAFRANEETLSSLTDMGFERSDCIAAIQATRTNDVSLLVPFLLENPGFIGTRMVDEIAPSPPAPQASSSLPADSSSVLSSSTSEVPPAVSSSASVVSMEIDDGNVGVQPPAAPTFVDGENSFTLSTLSSKSLRKDDELSVPPLPLIPQKTDEDLRAEKDFLPHLLQFLVNKSPGIFLSLIESGPCSASETNDNGFGENNNTIDSSRNKSTGNGNMNNNNQREFFTIMVLNQMLKLFEGYNLTDSTLRLFQLTWLYHKAISHLSSLSSSIEEEDGRVNEKVYGVLHAIVLILSSKISGNPNIKSGGNELLLLILRLDSRFNILYSLVIDWLDRHLPRIQEDQNKRTLVSDSRFSESSGQFVIYDVASVMLLLLDIMHQSSVIDRDSLKSSIREVDNIHKYNTGRAAEITAFNCFAEDILTALVKKEINEMFFPSATKRVTFSSTSASPSPAPVKVEKEPASKVSESGEKGSAEKEDESSLKNSSKDVKKNGDAVIEEKDLVSLPLLESGLDGSQRLKCASICVKIMAFNFSHSRLSSVAAASSSPSPSPSQDLSVAKISYLIRAVLQLMVHLLPEDDVRQHCHENKFHLSVLRCPLLFEGFTHFSFTLLQRQLEDISYLKQVMKTSIKITYDRMLRQYKAVHLKNFLEISSSLVYRNQRVFVTILCNTYDLNNPDGSSATLVLKQSLPKDSAADTSANEPAKGRSRSDDSTTEVAGVTGTGINELDNSFCRPSKKSKISELDSLTAKKSSDEPSLLRKKAHNNGNHPDHAQHVIRTQRNGMVHEMINELCSQIINRTIKLISDQGHDVLSLSFSSDTGANPSSRDYKSSVYRQTSDLIILLADLIAAIPSCSVFIGKFKTGTLSSLLFDKETDGTQMMEEKQEKPQSSVLEFLLQAFILQFQETKKKKEETTGNLPPSSSSAPSFKIMRSELLDSSAYFFASMLSRPGEGRKFVISEILRFLDFFLSRMRSSASILSSSYLKMIESMSVLLKFLNNLLTPPLKWHQRDSFIVPVKDIIQCFYENNLHLSLMSVFNELSSSFASCPPASKDKSASELIESLVAILDSFIRKVIQFGDNGHRVPVQPNPTSNPNNQATEAAVGVVTSNQPLSTDIPADDGEGISSRHEESLETSFTAQNPGEHNHLVNTSMDLVVASDDEGREDGGQLEEEEEGDEADEDDDFEEEENHSNESDLDERGGDNDDEEDGDDDDDDDEGGLVVMDGEHHHHHHHVSNLWLFFLR